MKKKEYKSPEMEICEMVSFSAQIAGSGDDEIIVGMYFDDTRPPDNTCDRKPV
jgi:hypothetical protein